jgi:hypothetical protein
LVGIQDSIPGESCICLIELSPIAFDLTLLDYWTACCLRATMGEAIAPHQICEELVRTNEIWSWPNRDRPLITIIALDKQLVLCQN